MATEPALSVPPGDSLPLWSVESAKSDSADKLPSVAGSQVGPCTVSPMMPMARTAPSPRQPRMASTVNALRQGSVRFCDLLS